MRVRFNKKGIIAAGVAGGLLLCGALFKISTDNGIIKNHEVAHVAAQNTGISDAIRNALDGNDDATVTVDANANAAVIAGVTMSEEATEAKAEATIEAPIEADVAVDAPALEDTDDAIGDVAADVQTTPVAAEQTAPAPAPEVEVAPEVVEEAVAVEEAAAPVVEEVPVVIEEAVPVTVYEYEEVEVPVEVTVVNDEAAAPKQSFADAVKAGTAAAAEDVVITVDVPEVTVDDDAENISGGDEFIIFE